MDDIAVVTLLFVGFRIKLVINVFYETMKMEPKILTMFYFFLDIKTYKFKILLLYNFIFTFSCHLIYNLIHCNFRKYF